MTEPEATQPAPCAPDPVDMTVTSIEGTRCLLGMGATLVSEWEVTATAGAFSLTWLTADPPAPGARITVKWYLTEDD